MRLLWASGTRHHDWSDGRHLLRLVETALDAGVVGDAEWWWVGPERSPMQIAADALPGAVAERIADGRPLAAVGGSTPHPWELHLVVSQWDEAANRVDGASLARFRFDTSRFSSADGSERLLDAMLALHSPATTEFAFAHPYDRAIDLAADVYKPPLVNSQMIAGAYWATFLGPGHIDEFDRARLREVSAYRVSWTGDDGVLFVALPVISEAVTPEGERELMRLTSELRQTLRSTA